MSFIGIHGRDAVGRHRPLERTRRNPEAPTRPRFTRPASDRLGRVCQSGCCRRRAGGEAGSYLV
jgi:hypothetical protein